ncbi:MAG: S8 family serine peptidase [Bradyrhizobium canariense]
MSKIGLDLFERIAAEQPATPSAFAEAARTARRASSTAAARLWVYIVFRGDPDTLGQAGFNIDSPFGTVGHAYLTIDEIERLALHDNVISIDLPPRVEPTLDRSVPDIRAPAAWGVPPLNPANTGKGRGSICGIIDTGFDVFHGSLRKDNGDTRILFYWDQTFAYDAAGNPVDSNGTALTGDNLPLDETDNVATPLRGVAVAGQQIGIDFDDGQINDALARHPDGKDLPVSLRDDGGSGHGTHVAGTAAGDGSDRDRCTPPFTYQGVAPEADLIVVKMGFSATRLQNPMAAINYIFSKASLVGRPCAINMSFGSHNAPHNGFSADSIAIDAAVAGTTGRAVIIAASNDREANLHVAEMIPAGTTTRINLVIEGNVTRVSIFGSYDSASALSYRLRLPPPLLPPPAPAPPAVPPARLTQVFNPASVAAQVQTVHGHTFISSARISTPGDPDRHFGFSITRPAPGARNVEAGTWQIELSTAGAISSNVHLWQVAPTPPYGGFRPFGFQPVAPVANPSPQDIARPAEWRRPENWISGTIAQASATQSAIIVAAYDAESVNTPIGSFSSQGPAVPNLTLGLYPTTPPDKPDIAAPGVAIHAPYANQRKPCFLCCECWVKHHTAMQGTSMAAPHVTGVAALMLAQDPALNATDVKRLIQETARAAPLLPGGWPATGLLFGAGNIDAFTCAFRAREGAEARAGGGGAPIPPSAFVMAPQPVRHPWEEFDDRFRSWERLFGKRPAWQLCAFLISTHFDEVKRLIDTNRRVAAVWQRHGGPLLVRRIVLGEEDADPPLPERIGHRPVQALIDRLVAILERYGGGTLKADVARYRAFVRRLPGLKLADIDTALVDEVPS